MRSAERAVWVAVVAALLAGLAVAARRQEAPTVRAVARQRSIPGTRVSMAVLHQQGGVPLGWQLSVPPGDAAAGRADFERLGCPACHRIAGETFSNSRTVRDRYDVPPDD